MQEKYHRALSLQVSSLSSFKWQMVSLSLFDSGFARQLSSIEISSFVPRYLVNCKGG